MTNNPHVVSLFLFASVFVQKTGNDPLHVHKESEINVTLRNDSNLVSNIPSGLVRDSFEQY